MGSLTPAVAGARQRQRNSAGKREPMPVRVLPRPLADYLESSAAAIGCCVSLVAVPALSVLAAAVGNSRRVRVKLGYEEPCVVWTAPVGRSGDEKSPAHAAATLPLTRLQREHDRAHAALAADRPEGDCPPPITLEINDTTLEALLPVLAENPRGLFANHDELDGWFTALNRYRGGGGSDRPHWLSFYNAKNVRVDRKTGTPRRLCVPGAAVSVTGTVQPAILRECLTDSNVASGLAARFLFAAPPSRARVFTDDVGDEPVVDAYDRLVRSLYAVTADDYADPPALPLDGAALAVWREFQREAALATDGADDPLRSSLAK